MRLDSMKAPIVSECKGCSKIVENVMCGTYLFPSSKWRFGAKCPVFDGNKEVIVNAEQKKLNPLKASRRKAKGR